LELDSHGKRRVDLIENVVGGNGIDRACVDLVLAET
jgi:hypothetical protein